VVGRTTLVRIADYISTKSLERRVVVDSILVIAPLILLPIANDVSVSVDQSSRMHSHLSMSTVSTIDQTTSEIDRSHLELNRSYLSSRAQELGRSWQRINPIHCTILEAIPGFTLHESDA
jgi:hypothetical protein